jgi:N-acetyl sugar amidotransferase
LIKYCSRCIIPNTRPNIVLGLDGICNACKSHGTKKDIDWLARRSAFIKVTENAKLRSEGYDCLVPVSGGKDSTWQILLCLEAGLTPLAVTWKTPARSVIGQKNLDNLVSLGVDHIDYQVNPKVEKKFILAAMEKSGDPAIPMHMALFNIPLKIATRFRIPLVVWGENSAFEYGTTEESLTGFRLDTNWLRTYGVTHGTTAVDWVSPDLSFKEMTPYFGPTESELGASGLQAVFLGYYYPWDPLETLRISSENGFRSRLEGPKTGFYNFADIDDDFISIHHWLKWYKFGMTRLFDNLSIEIRNGRLTRSKALEILSQLGEQRPLEDIGKMCEFLEIKSSTFYEMAEKFRNPKVWTKRGSQWTIDGFLLPDWTWS